MGLCEIWQESERERAREEEKKRGRGKEKERERERDGEGSEGYIDRRGRNREEQDTYRPKPSSAHQAVSGL